MAALTITAVRPTANSQIRIVNYGDTISPGQPLYRQADGEHSRSDADASALTKAVVGIAMTPGIDGGQGVMVDEGNIILVGATMTVGVTYFAGPSLGEIVPYADLSTGDYVVRIGTAKSATEMILSIEDTGVQVP